MSCLIDTDVLIDHLRGFSAARELLMELVSAGERPVVSVITVAEIEAGIKDSGRAPTDKLLSGLHSLPVDDEIAHTAGRYRARYGKSHGVLLPDAIIAATASRFDCQLYTLNRKHYPMDDINVVVPYKRKPRKGEA